jgi:hypothetical protein
LGGRRHIDLAKLRRTQSKRPRKAYWQLTGPFWMPVAGEGFEPS